MAKKLRIAFLGGVGEIGKNMTVFEYGDDMIVVDAGLTFPDFEETPGVEAVIPDFSYLKDNAQRIKGIFITHGHEDHIGALPYVLKEINAPVYGSNLSLGLLGSKLAEAKIKNVKTVTVTDRQIVKAGVFTVEFIRVTHSVAGSYALSITTPKGVVFVTGDFKIDHTPIDGRPTDLQRISEIGAKGVTLLMMDSTNVERPGYSMSERKVFGALSEEFDRYYDKRIIVATFASNIHRVQQIINCAIAHNRRVAFAGRSMIKIAEIAKTLGELKYPDDAVIDIEKCDKVPYDRLCIVCTGTQGEPMSALTRMANNDFKKVKISDLDVILFSSSAIPGNERSIYNVINNLSKSGADVVYHSLNEIHVSGHACKEELKLMFSLLKPKFFIPMHGEYRHLKLHKELALEMGIGESNIYLPDIGCAVEVDKSGIKKLAGVKSGEMYVDGSSLLDDNSMLMADRRNMAVFGCVIAVFKTSLVNGEVAEPTIITRGLDVSDALMAEMKNDIMSCIASGEFEEKGKEEAYLKVKRMILRKFQKRQNKRPTVVTIAEE